MQENKPFLVVGLGNPGPQYINMRHNVGFMAIDKFVGKDAQWKNEKNAQTTRLDVNGNKVIFVKPQTFMNNSGLAVGALMAFYKIPLEKVVVIHDDMDIALGKVKEKVGGSSAGHNGIRSIDAAVGPDYRRIRIGVGHPRDFNNPMSPSDWVLAKFDAEQLDIINKVIDSVKLF